MSIETDVWGLQKASVAHQALLRLCAYCHDQKCAVCPIGKCVDYLHFDVRCRLSADDMFAALDPDQERAVAIVERELRVLKGGRKRVRGHDPDDHPRGA